MKFIDITVGLSADVAPWPGDNSLQWKWPLRIGPDCPINLSCISFSPHLGTHVDAPLHYVPEGETVETIPLESLIGCCWVLDVSEATHDHAVLSRDDVGTQLHKLPLPAQGPVRILLKTGYRRENPFNTDFRYPSPEAIDQLAQKGTVLLGTDAPSMDHFHSKTLDSHRACHRHGITILENLALDKVSGGSYQLVALPLLLAGGESSPARVVLMPV